MDINHIKDTIETKITKRINSRANLVFLKNLLALDGSDTTIYIAGNSLNNIEVHDIDVFFPTDLCENMFDDGRLFDSIDAYNKSDTSNKLGRAELIHESRNATTVKFNNTIYQFCNYGHESLEKLVQSFDFSHIQIGVEIDIDLCGDETPKINDVYFTEAYLDSLLTGDSTYTGSEYPIGSLIRAKKYVDYGQLPKHSYRAVVMKCLTDIINRGFEDYPDFKDAINAIDLLTMRNINLDLAESLWRLWKAFVEHGLVKQYSDVTKKSVFFKRISEDSTTDSGDDSDDDDNDDSNPFEGMFSDSSESGETITDESIQVFQDTTTLNDMISVPGDNDESEQETTP